MSKCNFFSLTRYTKRLASHTAQTWNDIRTVKIAKKTTVHHEDSIAQPTVTHDVTPLHEPHVIFERSFEKDVQTGEVKKVQEQLRHLSFHDHKHPQWAY